MQKLVVIGAGLHYREKYHQVVKNHRIVLVIDLKSQERVIRQALGDLPQRYLFLDESSRNSVDLQMLEGIDVEADGALICTEPKVRGAYALWAAKRGWPMFLDKPATLTLDEFETLIDSGARGVVSCERRANLGYRTLFKIIDDFTEKYGVPLSNIDIHFAGGVWKTPQEYLNEENHPFKYGYGMLMHSGYHYVDLLAQLLPYGGGSKVSLNAISSTPRDVVYGAGDYPHLVSDDQVTLSDEMGEFGETDVMVMGQVLRNAHVMTNFSVKMLGTSLSMREQANRGEKLPGKIRQEGLYLHFGHLMSIQLSSTQFNRIDSTVTPEEEFTITVLRSPLIDGPRIERITRAEITTDPTSLNTAARKWQLNEFLSNRFTNSPLQSHRFTMQLIEQIYSELQCSVLSL